MTAFHTRLGRAIGGKDISKNMAFAVLPMIYFMDFLIIGFGQEIKHSHENE